MDAFSLLIFRLESYIQRIRAIYIYIFKFFLPGSTENGAEDGGFSDEKPDKVHL